MGRLFRFIRHLLRSYVPWSEACGGFLQSRVRLPEFVAFPVAFLVMSAVYGLVMAVFGFVALWVVVAVLWILIGSVVCLLGLC